MSPASQIDDDVADGLRAANKNVARGRLLERLRSVHDRPGNQAALTAMTHTGPARPADGDVAGLGQFQNALIGRRLPVCGYATARERYERTGFGVVCGQ